MAVLELTVDRQFQSMLIAEALRDLAELWAMISDPTDGRTVRAVLEEYLPVLIQTYGEPLAVQAAERFEEIRSMSGVSGRFTALLGKAPEADRINAHARRMIEPIFRGAESNPDEAFRNIENLVGRMTLEQSRRTTVENTFSRGSRAKGFVRVPTPGKDHCSFCIMLSSKTFGSEKSAKAGTQFHNKCWCKVTPLFEGLEIDGYSQEEQYRKYMELS